MDPMNGYQLPAELVALCDQVGKIIRDEIIPVEARIDPDAPKFPRMTIGVSRTRRSRPECGAWVHPKNTAAEGSAPSR